MAPKSESFGRLEAERVYPLATELLPTEAVPIFNLDPNLPLDLALAHLPYVSPDAIKRLTTCHDHYLQHQQVRVERIVGGSYSVYGSWAGSNHKETPEGVVTSIEFAQELARDKSYNYDKYEPIWLKPFVDDEGDVWFKADQGGHRIMAAKINCEEFLIANIIEPDKGTPMDQFNSLVIKSALEARAALPKSWAGRIGVWSLLRPTDTNGHSDRQQTQD